MDFFASQKKVHSFKEIACLPRVILKKIMKKVIAGCSNVDNTFSQKVDLVAVLKLLYVLHNFFN